VKSEKVNPQGQVLGDLCCNADLDAKPLVANLDARHFCRRYGNPLAMMGVALDHCLPERNAMLVTKPM